MRAGRIGRPLEGLFNNWQRKPAEIYTPQAQQQVAGFAEQWEPMNKKVYRRASLGTVLMLFYALSASSTVGSWVEWAVLGTGTGTITSAYIVAATSQTWFAICCGISIAVVEIIGRRISLQIAFIGQAVCLVPITVLLSLGLYRHARVIAFEFFAFLFLGFGGLSYGVIWLLVVEINTSSFRIVGTAIATIVDYAVVFAMGFAMPSLEPHKGWAAVFIAINALAWLATYLLFPETTGRRLEWIDRYFEQTPSAIVITDRAATKVRWSCGDQDIVLQSRHSRQWYSI